jgi:hypothetical protein
MAETIIVVDLLNIMYLNTPGKARVSTFHLLKDALSRKFPGRPIYYLADASARHKVDDKNAYDLICAKEGIVQTPAGEQADDYLLAYARSKPGCLIISCDRFRDHGVSSELQHRIIPVVIIGDEVLFSPKLDAAIIGSGTRPPLARA